MRDMSSDGAVNKPRSARPARGDDRNLASIALGVLLALALVATVVMIFSDNPVWMRIGTLAALWAAFIGAFLVARYRRQAAAEAARVRDLHTVYELQLEREISARREHELVVEKELRETVRAETADSVLALRREIAALREHLGALGVTLPEDRYAVESHAPAGEIGAGPTLPTVSSERVEPRRRAPGVGPDQTPSTERTEKFSPVEPERPGPRARPTVQQVQPSSGSEAPAGTGTGPATGTESVRRPAVRPARPAAEPARGAAESTPPRDTSQATPPREEPAPPREEPASTGVEPAPTALPSRHGEGTGLSVAELMARIGGDSAPSGGRRRRRRAAD